LIADYTGEAIEEEQVHWVIEHAKLFVEAIQQQLAPIDTEHR
jgi:hypothetical protein